MTNRWWLVLERTQAALPLLAAAALGAFTWWLVQSAPKDGGEQAAAAPVTHPDAELAQARVLRFTPDGHIQAVLDGSTMRHYTEPARVEIDDVRLLAQDAEGQRMWAQARQGLADDRGLQVNLRGDALVRLTPVPSAPAASAVPIDVVGEDLLVQTDTQVLTSQDPVTVIQAGNEIHGRWMRHDRRAGTTELGGRVRGHYTAAPQ